MSRLDQVAGEDPLVLWGAPEAFAADGLSQVQIDIVSMSDDPDQRRRRAEFHWSLVRSDLVLGDHKRQSENDLCV
jgi:hypothetical protein